MFNYNKFCNIIQHLGLLKEQAERINFILNDPLYKDVMNDLISPFAMNNPTIENDLVEALEEMYFDKEHWISYFIYELDFGRQWKPGMIKNNKGNEIKLKTISELWTLLQENLNDNI